jgi:hypothetical protein
MEKLAGPEEKLVSDLAKEAGVSVEDTQKVLSKLGLNALITNVTEAVGDDNLRKISVGDLKIAAKLGRSSVAV